MTLNDLLEGKGVDPAQVVVMRHRPREPQLNRVMPWLAAEHPDLFNAYQQTQGETVEKVLQKVTFVASFLGRSPGKAVFVGLYRVNGWTPMPTLEVAKLPPVAALVAHGTTLDPKRPMYLWFDLSLDGDFYPEWKGRLVIKWPPPEWSWWRRAHKSDGMTVLAIREESAFDAALPPWDQLVLSWDELAVIPSRLKAKLSEWRGIYYIYDAASGKGYVGSAAGGDNLLGRWEGYAATGHGGNVLLRNCDQKNLQFSILQRVSPDMPPAEVVEIETTWKKRLHTRAPAGLNDN